MCGEKSGFCQRSILHLGSPPRMRGKAIVIQRVDRLGGITPACAGKSTMHLRFRVSGSGSPPRVRGKEPLRAITICCARITPACAGKRQHTCGPCGCQGDHPRVCGEKDPARCKAASVWGSPPRVRGKDVIIQVLMGLSRITPACAGKRGRPRSGQGPQGDHPRVCGEKIRSRCGIGFSQGSPPRVRGKGGKVGPFPALSGITPACAGKRRGRGTLRTQGQDHPRVCGEKSNNCMF